MVLLVLLLIGSTLLKKRNSPSFQIESGDFVLSTVKVESITFAHRSLLQPAYATADMQQHLSAACAG